MAHNDTEIEVKFRVNKEEFLNIKSLLEKNSIFAKRTMQSDKYFTPVHRNFTSVEFPFEWLSIRNRGGKFILNYKHLYPENKVPTTHCDELETNIEKPENLEKIFNALNFKHLTVVEKERDTYVHNNELEIALDTVKELGYFIEIESIKDFGSVDAAREAIFGFAKKLGLDETKIETGGYPFLMLKKD